MVGSVSFAQPSNVISSDIQPSSLPMKPLPQAQTVPIDIKDQVNLTAKLPAGKIPTGANVFSAQPFNVIEEGKKNTTANYSKENMPVSVLKALEPTIKLVEAVDPAIGKAIRKLDENDFGLSKDGMTAMFQHHDIYAAWVAVAREGTKFHFSDMILDNNFWRLRDAEKATILIHEMTHAGETPIISHFEKLAGTIRGLIKKDYGDMVEDRAYLKQLSSFPKLGITERDDMYWEVKTYLEDRKLWPSKN